MSAHKSSWTLARRLTIALTLFFVAALITLAASFITRNPTDPYRFTWQAGFPLPWTTIYGNPCVIEPASLGTTLYKLGYRCIVTNYSIINWANFALDTLTFVTILCIPTIVYVKARPLGPAMKSYARPAARWLIPLAIGLLATFLTSLPSLQEASIDTIYAKHGFPLAWLTLRRYPIICIQLVGFNCPVGLRAEFNWPFLALNMTFYTAIAYATSSVYLRIVSSRKKITVNTTKRVGSSTRSLSAAVEISKRDPGQPSETNFQIQRFGSNSAATEQE